MKHSVIFAGLGILILAGCASTGKPQEQSSLAVLPFMGMEGGEFLADLLIDNLQHDFKVIPRSSVINDIRNKELEFQRSDVTDLDTIAAIGKELNADFVVAGYIQSFQGINFLFINIMDIKTLQLVAGDYTVFDKIENIPALLPAMAKKIVKAPRSGGKPVRELAVFPFIMPGVGDQEAETLAQIAAIEVMNSGNYTVLPRTQAIKQAMAEQQIQQSNLGDLTNIQSIGKAINARYVLAGQIGSLGSKQYFLLRIVNVEQGDIVISSSAEYQALTEGLDYIPLLSHVISGQKTEAQKKQAIQKQKRDARIAEKAEYAFRNHLVIPVFVQWGDDGLLGGGYSIGIHWSPAPFTVLGLDARLGGIDGTNIKSQPMTDIAPTLGLVFPFTKHVKIFGDGLLEIGYFGGLSGLIAENVSPGFDLGILFWWDWIGFDLKYRGGWYENHYLHSIGIGFLFGGGKAWRRW